MKVTDQGEVMAMAGSRRKDAARARLNADGAGASDAELVERALTRIADAVEQRSPLSEEQASDEVAREVRQMRLEKRADQFVASMTAPRG